MLLDRTGLIQSINSAGADLLGYAPEELVGSYVKDLEVELQFEGRSTSKSSALLQLAATHPERINDIVANVVRKRTSGGVWVRVNASLMDKENEYGLDGVVVSLKDVTESRRQGETLKAILRTFQVDLSAVTKT